jgi:hypothetical protein
MFLAPFDVLPQEMCFLQQMASLSRRSSWPVSIRALFEKKIESLRGRTWLSVIISN